MYIKLRLFPSILQKRRTMDRVFEYQDYREYLKDYYAEQKSTRKSFSYRSFSRKAGISTPSFLHHVIDGKKNLTKNSIVKISMAIGHSREDQDYFENLVFFNQASTITEKTHYYSRLIETRRPIDIKRVDIDKYEYYEKWYHSIIREVVTLFDFGQDYQKLAGFLIPPVTTKEARDSIRLLERLGFIEQDENGLYHQTNKLIASSPGPTSLYAVQRFQMEMLKVALTAYDNIPVNERISTSTTFSISRATFELFKLRISQFQRELMGMACVDNEQEQAYQITVNLFPVSRSTKNGNKKV